MWINKVWTKKSLVLAFLIVFSVGGFVWSSSACISLYEPMSVTMDAYLAVVSNPKKNKSAVL